MTPEQFAEWMALRGLNTVRGAEALGITRKTLTKYLKGDKNLPRSLTLACVGYSAVANWTSDEIWELGLAENV